MSIIPPRVVHDSRESDVLPYELEVRERFVVHLLEHVEDSRGAKVISLRRPEEPTTPLEDTERRAQDSLLNELQVSGLIGDLWAGTDMVTIDTKSGPVDEATRCEVVNFQVHDASRFKQALLERKDEFVRRRRDVVKAQAERTEIVHEIVRDERGGVYTYHKYEQGMLADTQQMPKHQRNHWLGNLMEYVYEHPGILIEISDLPENARPKVVRGIDKSLRDAGYRGELLRYFFPVLPGPKGNAFYFRNPVTRAHLSYLGRK